MGSIWRLFPKHLFWDMDYKKLNLKKDADIIIPRALYATTAHTFTDDITKLERIYSPEQIVEELKLTKERISNEVCSLVSKRYHIASFSRYSR